MISILVVTCDSKIMRHNLGVHLKVRKTCAEWKTYIDGLASKMEFKVNGLKELMSDVSGLTIESGLRIDKLQDNVKSASTNVIILIKKAITALWKQRQYAFKVAGTALSTAIGGLGFSWIVTVLLQKASDGGIELLTSDKVIEEFIKINEPPQGSISRDDAKLAVTTIVGEAIKKIGKIKPGDVVDAAIAWFDIVDSIIQAEKNYKIAGQTIKEIDTFQKKMEDLATQTKIITAIKEQCILIGDALQTNAVEVKEQVAFYRASLLDARKENRWCNPTTGIEFLG